MRTWPLLSALVAVGCALPAAAQTPAWQGTLDRLAEKAAHPPASLKLRSVAVKEIVDERTQARWPLSDQLETALAEAIARQHPSFALLNQGAAAAPGGSGEDAVLTGIYRHDLIAKRTTIALVMRRLRNGETLFTLPSVELDDAALPEGALASAGFGRLALTCEVPGAQVFLDGNPVGKGSQVQPLSVGSHVVTVAAEGYEVFEAPVEIRADQAVLLKAPLRRSAAPLRLEGSPAGARLTIDGEEKGVLPAVLELSAGKHRLAASYEGYRPFERDIEVDASKPATLSVALEPIPGSLLVSVDGPGASLTLDGQPAGRTPHLFSDMRPGLHQLRVESPGYQPWEQAVRVEGDRMANVRVKLLRPGQPAEVATAIALVPRTSAREDLLLANRVAQHLAQYHPAVPLIGPELSQQSVELLFPEGLREDRESIAQLAAKLKARQLYVVGVEGFAPFSRTMGAWPNRPELKVKLGRFRASGLAEENRQYARTGGEPWGLGNQAPDAADLSERLAADLSDAIAGEPTPRPEVPGAEMLNEAYLLLGGSRLNLALNYERRVLPFLGLGMTVQYCNALNADRTSGTQLAGAASGSDLVYGVGQAVQGRLDALLRFDGQAGRIGPYFEGARWSPYAGVGYRLDANRYEVFGVGRKNSEGGFWLPLQRGVAIAGIKLNLGGAIVKTELEAPFLYSVWDTPDLRWTLGGGTAW